MEKELNKNSFAKQIVEGIKRFIGTYPLLPAMLVLGLVLSLASENFLTSTNLINILRQSSMTAIMAVGMYFVLVGGGIDASLGAIVGLCSIVYAMINAKLGLPFWLAGIFAIMCGAAAGAANGIAVAWFSIPPLIATIGVKMILVGITYIICQGYSVNGIEDAAIFIGRGYIGDWLPIPVFIMILIAVIADFVSTRTRYGRRLYTTGGNPEAAHLSGINHKRIYLSTYVIAGVLAAITAIIITGRLGAGKAATGDGWEFDAIIGCVIGGISTTGGKGRVFGAVLGTIMLGMVENGMTLLNINSYYQQVVSGLVLIVAIGIDVYNSLKKRNKVRK